MRYALLAVSLVIWPAAAFAAPAKTVTAENKQQVLQAPDGRSLYVFDGDSAGASNCIGDCLKLWPPFLPTADEKSDGDWTVLSRSDGAKQWMYKGRPLYLFARDTKPGQTEGNSFNGNKWHLAKP